MSLVSTTTTATTVTARRAHSLTKGTTEMSTYTEHTPACVLPQPTNVVAYLRDNAQHGATLVTRNGVSVVETGHSVSRYVAQPPKRLAYRHINRGVIGSTATLGHSASDLLRADISEA